MQATNLGYPRIGANRELKWWVEAYWRGELDRATLEANVTQLQREIWKTQSDAGLDLVPCGDFSLYDHVLDTAVMFGIIPERFRWEGGAVDLDLYFALARGKEGAVPCEMTKWFDTNYHYMVPEFSRPPQLTQNRALQAFRAARAAGVSPKPVLLGPFSFAALGRLRGARLAEVVSQLTPLYAEVLRELAREGAEWTQMDEPCVVLDWDEGDLAPLSGAYAELSEAASPMRLMVQTYFGHVEDKFPLLLRLPVAGLGLDFVRGREANLRALREHRFPSDKFLGIGIVDGRNVWRTDLDAALQLLEQITEILPAERTFLHPSCSLMHLPVTVAQEPNLPADLKAGLAFARERLDEVVLLARAMREGKSSLEPELAAARERRARFARLQQPNPQVRARLSALTEKDFQRPPAAQRKAAQQARLNLPLLPTTTIGSFPQTPEIRAARRRWHASEISTEEYEEFLRREIARVIKLQEDLGLDVLVHGEPERSDMVEYFAEQLNGFAVTQNAWVQSYGTRCVRPPLLYGDIARPQPMTVRWASYAQSVTTKPMKGMLTGPVTIMNWSFVRTDLPREEVAYQLALAIRDEVRDLEAAGLQVIQIDEPALREGLPLRKAERDHYLRWAVRAFRLATSVADAATQIQTHMCYADFGDILDAIDAMDADVLLAEDSRSGGALAEQFGSYGYSRDLGPGVYDVHSPLVPSVETILAQLRRALRALNPQQLWVNPDCGLKTRGYAEVKAALQNMVTAAQQARAELVK